MIICGGTLKLQIFSQHLSSCTCHMKTQNSRCYVRSIRIHFCNKNICIHSSIHYPSVSGLHLMGHWASQIHLLGGSTIVELGSGLVFRVRSLSRLSWITCIWVQKAFAQICSGSGILNGPGPDIVSYACQMWVLHYFQGTHNIQLH